MNYSSFLRLFEELVNIKELQIMMQYYSQSYDYDISNIFMKFPILTNYDALNFIKFS
jgi:hypothetical protein